MSIYRKMYVLIFSLTLSITIGMCAENVNYVLCYSCLAGPVLVHKDQTRLPKISCSTFKACPLTEVCAQFDTFLEKENSTEFDWYAKFRDCVDPDFCLIQSLRWHSCKTCDTHFCNVDNYVPKTFKDTENTDTDIDVNTKDTGSGISTTQTIIIVVVVILVLLVLAICALRGRSVVVCGDCDAD